MPPGGNLTSAMDLESRKLSNRKDSLYHTLPPSYQALRTKLSKIIADERGDLTPLRKYDRLDSMFQRAGECGRKPSFSAALNFLMLFTRSVQVLSAVTASYEYRARFLSALNMQL